MIILIFPFVLTGKQRKSWLYLTDRFSYLLRPGWLKVQFSCSVMSDSLRPQGLQHARLPCPSPTLRAYSNSCPSHRWCHPTISSSVVSFSSCLQYFPVSRFFISGGQSTGVSASASVLLMNIKDLFPLPLHLTPSPLLIGTGGSTPLLCLQGFPDLPGAPQDEAGLMRKFET